MSNGQQEYVVNPQPGYRTEWKGWGPRIQAAWQITDKLQAHAGGAITVIPPNIWQDNFLTGSTPFAVMPRLLSAIERAHPLWISNHTVAASAGLYAGRSRYLP